MLRLILAATYLAVVAVPSVNALSSGAHVRVPVGSAVAGLLTGLAVVAALGGPLGATGVGLGYLCGTAVTAGGPVVTAWRQHAMPWAAPARLAAAVVGGAYAVAAVTDGVADVSVRLALAASALVIGVAVLSGHMRALRDDSAVGQPRDAGSSPSRWRRRV
ncbi:hypothetical protein [Phytohabitans rumicis]|uniref:Polysaccharide biosynthesis protein C-terminal domain-containing protein n=1 Tax=Phytohabitans rumicis TaxID=1076125 RepID=A0A6V8LKM8_9ACTN|nr:hypothetical protein [Phytohabitans rumicis]GFJ94627.1 hypothetical protein Prum_082690 [Phytohabitans rumicis]